MLITLVLLKDYNPDSIINGQLKSIANMLHTGSLHTEALENAKRVNRKKSGSSSSSALVTLGAWLVKRWGQFKGARAANKELASIKALNARKIESESKTESKAESKVEPKIEVS